MKWEEVRKLALAMPDVTEGASYGTPAFRVRGKLLARLREEGVLVVRTEAKDALIDHNPRVYFTIAHYDGYPMVLVRLQRIQPGELRELLFDAYRELNPERGLRAKVRAAILAIDGIEEHLPSSPGGARTGSAARRSRTSTTATRSSCAASAPGRSTPSPTRSTWQPSRRSRGSVRITSAGTP